MAFKKMTEYNEARYGGFFVLRNDGDSADVVFLYRNLDDVLMADVHYIKSDTYSGYVHCCGRGCPACAAGIRLDSKLFIPIYNINEGQIQFFDRSIRFESQLQQDVFNNYPNPSEYIFKIIRHGAANDVNTRYEIRAVARNTGEGKIGSYDEILARCGATMPGKYEDVCKEFSPSVLSDMLNKKDSGFTAPSEMPEYQITPRQVTAVEAPADFNAAPVELPNLAGFSIDAENMSDPSSENAVVEDDISEVTF